MKAKLKTPVNPRRDAAGGPEPGPWAVIAKLGPQAADEAAFGPARAVLLELGPTEEVCGMPSVEVRVVRCRGGLHEAEGGTNCTLHYPAAVSLPPRGWCVHVEEQKGDSYLAQGRVISSPHGDDVELVARLTRVYNVHGAPPVGSFPLPHYERETPTLRATYPEPGEEVINDPAAEQDIPPAAVESRLNERIDRLRERVERLETLPDEALVGYVETLCEEQEDLKTRVAALEPEELPIGTIRLTEDGNGHRIRCQDGVWRVWEGYPHAPTPDQRRWEKKPNPLSGKPGDIVQVPVPEDMVVQDSRPDAQEAAQKED